MKKHSLLKKALLWTSVLLASACQYRHDGWQPHPLTLSEPQSQAIATLPAVAKANLLNSIVSSGKSLDTHGAVTIARSDTRIYQNEHRENVLILKKPFDAMWPSIAAGLINSGLTLVAQNKAHGDYYIASEWLTENPKIYRMHINAVNAKRTEVMVTQTHGQHLPHNISGKYIVYLRRGMMGG